MKKSLLLFSVFFLVGCELNVSDNSNNYNSSSTKNSTLSSSTSLSAYSSNSSPSLSNQTGTSSSLNSTSTESISYYDGPVESFEINSYSLYDIGSYETGNYDITSIHGYDFEYYRAIEPEFYGDTITLLPYASHFEDKSLPGMIYNLDPILGIKEISINYKTENNNGTKPVLRYGEDASLSNSIELPLSSSSTSFNIKIKNAHFFKIETNDYILHIEDIELKYTNEGNINNFKYFSSGDNKFRINPITYEESLVSGKSKVCVPTLITRNGDSYIVNECKEYTYYEYSYVTKNPSVAEEASYTSPEDVAAYFIAFGTYPANYVLKKNYKTAKNYFGSNTRCVSQYNRTDGYARFVPWASAPGSYAPVYYECDIALTDDYSNNNRGVGRVVVWLYGFNSEGYDNSPVAVYTDDHYATFQEYLNTGVYGTRFNAEMSPTNYIWGTPNILTIN